MNPDEVSSRLRHPAGRDRMRRTHEDDQFDAWAEEAVSLANSSPMRAAWVADVFIASFLGSITGFVLVLFLLWVAL